MFKVVDKIYKDERGVTAIEYGVLGAVVATILAFVFNGVEDGFLDVLTRAYQGITAAFSF